MGDPRHGETVSLGIHESQSRLWENLVGRSRGFWRFFYRRAQETFPVPLDVPLKIFHFAINEVKPSLISHRGRRSDLQPAHPPAL